MKSIITSILIIITSSAQAADKPADRVFYNANIYTADPQKPEASAVAIRDGRFIYVGSDEGSEAFIDDNTELIDLNGYQLLPGFIDNHNHVFEADSAAGGFCVLSPSKDMLGQKPYLSACKKNLQSGGWVTGYGHVFESIAGNLSSPMPIEVLDKIFPNNPVVIMEQTSHSMLVNSEALALAKIDEKSPDPQGGIIMRDQVSGRINGVLFDNAGDIVMALAWNSQSNVFKLSYEGLTNGLYAAASNGITTIGDGRMYWKRGWYPIWQEALKNNAITARVSIRPWIYPDEKPQLQLNYLAKIHNDDINSLLVVNQVKMYSDGILNLGTAKMLDPYTFTYHKSYPKGLNYIPAEQLKTWLEDLSEIGYGAHIHAIGDGAVRETLDAIENVRQQGSNLYYNMTHLEVIRPKDIPRFKQLNVHADFQIGSEWALEGHHDWAAEFIGKKNVHNMLPIRALINSGANVTLSSDWNVNPISPLAAISNSQITGAKPLFDIYGAIDAYTINPAKALGLESLTGSIEVGKSADLVVLNRVITEDKPSNIPKAKVILTVLQGEVVFDIDD